MESVITFANIKRAVEVLSKSKHVTRTPLLRVDSRRFGIAEDVELYLKMEGMQNTGSFKIRGVVNVMEHAPSKEAGTEFVTMSAGNFGRSFAYMCRELGLTGRVLMPITAPDNRELLIRSFGMEVERMPTSELQSTVDRYVAEKGMVFVHPFDDLQLIAGYASIGLEIVQDLPDVDVVLVCCGGGGLLAGTAAGIKISGLGENVQVFGVEPEGASTMHLSLQAGKPLTKGDVKSIAAGLAPPYVGKNTFKIVSQLVEGIVLVSEEEIKEGVRILYENGLVVEPSGAAAFAALRSGKVTGISGKKVALTISGSNVSPAELVDLLK